jgi:hypothetical protein
MNEFYSIGEENRDQDNQYQLKNLGSQMVSMVVGRRIRGDWGERDTYQSDKYYTKTTDSDYDRSFANKIAKTKPPYDICNLLDYHLNYYVNQNNGTKEKFAKQIRYVIIPLIKKMQDKEVYLQLINEWLDDNQKNMNYKKDNNMKTILFGDINAPTQIQVDSSNSHQVQSITYSKENINELFSLIKADLENLKTDLKEDLSNEIENAIKYLEKGKDIKSRLLTIGGLIKDIGISVFANLVASPIFELLKPALGI